MLIYLPQAIGFVGLLLAMISFQKNDNKGILFFQLLAALTFSLHFVLLGAYTGATMNLLGAARNIVFFNREKGWANKQIWLYTFILSYIIVGLLTWENPYSVLPIIAMILSTIGLWIKDAKITRMIVLPSSPFWLVYNFVNSSIAGVFTELFVLSSLVVAVIRFDILKKQKAID